MNTSVTLLTSDPEDALALSFRRLGHASAVIDLDELAPYIVESAWPDVLRTQFPDALTKRFDGSFVFNRLFSLDSSTVQRRKRAFDIDDLWIHVRLSPLLKRAACLAHDTGVRGVSRCLLPLNNQWKRLREVDPDLSIPDFAFGFGNEMPVLDHLQTPLLKSIWDIFDWRNADADDTGPRHRFYLQRPAGTPYLRAFLGTQTVDLALGDGSDPSLVAAARMEAACRRAFRTDAGEFLYFQSGSEITFAAFCPKLQTAAKFGVLDAMAEAWFRANAQADQRIDHGASERWMA
jgi:hypothetical protein